MKLERLLKYGIIPAHDELVALGISDSPQARRLSVAIALQESQLRHRRQVTSEGAENGPASSFWQFEKNGACKGVLLHHATEAFMNRVCSDFNVDPTPSGLWEAMRYNDIVAAAAARLLIYTLPNKLPETPLDGWKQYINAWRPGKPRPDSWNSNWEMADLLVQSFN